MSHQHRAGCASIPVLYHAPWSTQLLSSASVIITWGVLLSVTGKSVIFGGEKNTLDRERLQSGPDQFLFGEWVVVDRLVSYTTC